MKATRLTGPDPRAYESGAARKVWFQREGPEILAGRAAGPIMAEQPRAVILLRGACQQLRVARVRAGDHRDGDSVPLSGLRCEVQGRCPLRR
jgi:hypothetical protein